MLKSFKDRIYNVERGAEAVCWKRIKILNRKKVACIAWYIDRLEFFKINCKSSGIKNRRKHHYKFRKISNSRYCRNIGKTSFKTLGGRYCKGRSKKTGIASSKRSWNSACSKIFKFRNCLYVRNAWRFRKISIVSNIFKCIDGFRHYRQLDNKTSFQIKKNGFENL